MLKKQKTTSTGFQPQTQTTSVFLNPNINSTKITENLSPTEVTAISIPTSPTLTPGITIYCKVLKKLLEAMLIFEKIQNHLKSLHR